VKRLSKEQAKQKEVLVKAMLDQEDAYSVAVADYNEKVGLAWADLEQALCNYNSARGAVVDFMSEVAAEMEAYFDERSDAWREGEAGERYEVWRDAWGEEPDREVEVDSPVSLDESDDNLSDILAGLPENLDEC